MKIARNVLFAIISVLLLQCAKQTTPGGGPKDETPPKLIESNPPDRKTNFNKNEIELIFDELIQVNNAREQLVITPAIGKKFELTARKNKATLKLNSTLKENTTYTIAFRESIQDLTERIPAINLKLSFSTGTYIDSLSITGVVYNLFESKPAKNATVAAFPYSDTLDIFQHEAQWITFTNENGEYNLENLKAGQYVVYAFDDKNKNLIVDSKSEYYGFIGNPVDLQQNISNLEIPLIILDTRPFKLISAKPLTTYYNIRLSKGYSSYEISPFIDQKLISFSENSSTIRVYNTFPVTDSLQIQFKAKDSINNMIDTLLYLKFDSRSSNKEKFNAKIEQLQYLENASLLKGVLQFSKPVQSYAVDSIYIQLDSVNFIRFTIADFRYDKENTHLILEKKLPKGTDFTKQPSPRNRTGLRKGATETTRPVEEEKEVKLPEYNQLIAKKGAFISVENDTAVTLQSQVSTIKPDNSGTILISVNTTEKVILQLVTKAFNVISQSTQHQVRFDNLIPGDYMIRAIIDKNGNGKWDPGNYFLKEEPEPVFYYRNEKGNQIVSLKANWELGPLLITTEKNVDNKLQND